MDEAELAPFLDDEYRHLGALNFLNDSYFSIPQHQQLYGHEERRPPEQQEQLGIEHTAFFPPFPGFASSQPHQSQVAMDLDVLSARDFHEGPEQYGGRGPNQHETGEIQLWGGLVETTNPHESPSRSPPATRRSRRISKKDDPKIGPVEDSSNRQRGRPRLNTKDQTAAERRRTQIRLAQRAYRQRKETTISGLNRRVAALEKTIEEMNSAFFDFKDKAVSAGIQRANPRLANYLESIAEHVAKLAKGAAHVSDAEEEEEDELNRALSGQSMEPDESKLAHNRRTVAGSESTHVPMMGYQAVYDEINADNGEIARQVPIAQAQQNNLLLPGWNGAEAMQHPQTEMLATTGFTDNTFGQCEQFPSAVGNVNELRDFNNGDVMHYRVDVPALSDAFREIKRSTAASSFDKQLSINPWPLGKTFYDIITLPSPKDFSSQEASFARRLIRYSLEASYRLATNPGSKSEDISRVFKFSWCFANTSRIAEQIRRLLRRSVNENLELWQVPAMHIGGAGLHYPRVGIDAGGQPPEWWANQAPIGPIRFSQPETPVPETMTVEQVIESVGFGGEWFDANDVEQYLRSKGLFLDGQSSVVELQDVGESTPGSQENLEVPATSPGTSSSLDSSGGPHSPHNADLNSQIHPFLQGTDYFFSEDNVNLAEVPDVNMDLSLGDFDYSAISVGAKTSAPDLDLSALGDDMPTFNTKMRKFIDVEKFLDTIVQSGVCLGRTPGYRRAAVDSALTKATIERP